MADREVIFSEAKIKWVGIVDLAVFYKKLQEWLKIKKYSTTEKRYVEKIKPNGKQIEMVWECKRTDIAYVNLIIKIQFFMIGVVEAEAEKEGKRLKLNKIDAELTIDSEVLKDPKGEWKKSPYMKKIYEKYMIKQQLEDIKIECYKNTSDMIEEIKKYFELYALK